MSFKELISDQKILQAIEESGFTEPTPIQKEVIPKVLEGRDICGAADTGTGKTAAFLLPALMRLLEPPSHPGKKGPRILVLVPTRELAMQVAGVARRYSTYLPRIKTVAIFGGSSYVIQNKELSRPYEILVATPGRLIDHLERERIDLSRVEILILDEADRMLDMGFIEPVEFIAKATPKTRQTMLFSATFNKKVMELSRELMSDPLSISVASSKEISLLNIEERIHRVDNIDHKYRILKHLLKEGSIHQTIIFTSTKRQADRLADELSANGFYAKALHGDMQQRARTQTIGQLRQGSLKVLVATDVAARGIDVLTISHVINFDLPMSPEDYVHRIGRTGRAGASGIALSFVSPKEIPLLRRIEKYTGKKLNFHTIASLEPTAFFGEEKEKSGKRPPHTRFFKKDFQRKKPAHRGSGNYGNRNVFRKKPLNVSQ